MPTYDTTDRYALRALSPGSTNVVADIDAGFVALRNDVSAKLTPYDAGPLASRPVSTAGTPGIAGRHYYAADIGIQFVDLGTAWAPAGIPLGGGVDWFGSSDPCAELMICDGRAISRTTYSALFTLLGTTFGAGNGTTTFNIPDTRDRVLVGASGTIGRGATGGEKTHALSVGELAVHTHTASQPAHRHGTGGQNFAQTDGVPISAAGSANAAATSATDATTYQTPAITVANAGSGTAHNNMQPYLGANKIIRVL